MQKIYFNEETKFSVGNYQPTWVTNIMLELLFATMENYRRSKCPLTLFQLCRQILQQGELVCTLRCNFANITDPVLRSKLFHTKQMNSD